MFETGPQREDYVGRALETTIHVGLFLSLAAACLLILRPFALLICWGIIIAIASHPAYLRLKAFLRGHGTFAAVAITVLLLTFLIVPVVLLTGSLVDGAQSVAAKLRNGEAVIPPPPPRVETWPLIGGPLHDAWDLMSRNLSAALRTYGPQIRVVLPELLSASAGIGLAALQWMFSIVVAGILLASDETAAKMTGSLSRRLLGERGPEFEALATSTIRSVTTGIVGVALIQTLFAVLGFYIAKIPAAGLWSLIFLVGAVLQIGGLVLIPAAIYMFAIASTTHASIFLVWCVFVGLMDNVLKPMLLGRGASVPMLVVFLGAIGGFVALGPIGLFVGAVVLSVGYKLVLAWLEESAKLQPVLLERSASVRSGV